MGKRKRNKPTKFRVGDYVLDTHRGAYVARFRDESTGQLKKLTLGARGQKLTEEQAKVALQQYVDSRSALAKLQSDYTCGALWKRWMEERQKDGFDCTIYSYNWKALEPHFANRRPTELSADDFRDYAIQRFEAGRKPQTVHTELIRLRHCLRWAFDNNLIAKPIKVWTPSRGKGRQLAMSFAEAKAILDQAGDPHIRLFILLAMTTGARHRAILDLTWDRVNWETNSVDYDVREDANPMHKNYKKGRANAPFGAMVRDALLQAYRGRQTDHVIEHGGRRLKSVRDGFANAVWRAGLNENYTPHILRHSVVTWAVEKTGDYYQCAKLVGHANVDTTKLVYDHTTAEVARPVVEHIEQSIAALPANEILQRKKGTKRGAKRASIRTEYRAPKDNPGGVS